MFNNVMGVVVLIGMIMAEGGVFFRNASGALMLAYAYRLFKTRGTLDISRYTELKW